MSTVAYRAAIYARISSDREGDGAGVQRQIEDCRRAAERLGWTVVEEYVDNDVSAYSGKPRPQYRRLLEDIKAGAVDALVFWHPDRLHRQPRELEEFIDVVDSSRIQVHSVCNGDVDLSTGDGRMVARILGAVSRKESDDKSRRILRKHQDLAAAGKRHGGGTRAFGYDESQTKVVGAEAAVIREVAKRLLAGDNPRSICVDLNARGVVTVGGKAWATTSLRRIMMSGRISGQREHRGEIVASAEWPAIIAPEDTARLRALLGDPARRTNRAARRYLLAGLLRCGLCDARLVSRPRSDGRRRYVCAKGPGLVGCGGVAILADDLEQWLVEAVLYRLDSPAVHDAMTGRVSDNEQATAAQAEVIAVTAKLNDLADLYGNDGISLQEWTAARRPLTARLDTAKKRLARLSDTTAIADFVGNAGSLRAQWQDLSLNRQRAVIAAVLTHLTVGPAVKGRNTFDPGRLSPTWKV